MQALSTQPSSRTVPHPASGAAIDIALSEVVAQGVGGSVFQVVGFVDDQVIVFRQDTVPDGDIRQQQGMVDNQQVGALGCLAGAVERAGAAGALDAGIGRAGFIFRRDAHPRLALDRPVDVDLGAVAGDGGLQPHQGFRQHAQFFGVLGRVSRMLSTRRGHR